MIERQKPSNRRGVPEPLICGIEAQAQGSEASDLQHSRLDNYIGMHALPAYANKTQSPLLRNYHVCKLMVTLTLMSSLGRVRNDRIRLLGLMHLVLP